MKFELYVRHILQEFPDVEIPIAEWTGRWVKTDSYGKYCPCKGAVAKVPIDPIEDISSVFLREEKFGGLLYDPKTTAIYKLDNEAFQIVQNMQRLLMKDKSLKKDKIKFIQKLNASPESFNKIIEYLVEADLW